MKRREKRAERGRKRRVSKNERKIEQTDKRGAGAKKR